MNKNYKIALITITAFILAGTIAAGVLLGFSFAENNKNDKDSEEKETYSQSVTAKPDRLLHEDVSIPDVTMSEDVSRPDEEATLPQDVPVATEPASAAPTAPAAPSYITANEEDLNQLKYLALNIWGDFDKNSSDAVVDAYEHTIGTLGIYYSIFGDEVLITGTPDPLNLLDRMNSGYYEYNRYKAENVDWIIRNIFGLEPDHSLLISDESYHTPMYYHDGYYYSYYSPTGMVEYAGDIIDCSADQNGVYTLKFEILNPDDTYAGYIVVKAKLHIVDGEKVWTIHQLRNEHNR